MPTQVAVSQEHVQRILMLRRIALGLLHRDGFWQEIEGYPGRVRSYRTDRLLILHRTPFQPVPISQQAVLAGISPHVQRQIARAYGLDIWQDNKKVLSLIWNDGAAVGIVLFRQGLWEDVLLSAV